MYGSSCCPQVKVDAKTRKDLLKYIITKKKGKDAKEEEVCGGLGGGQ